MSSLNIESILYAEFPHNIEACMLFIKMSISVKSKLPPSLLPDKSFNEFM